MSAEDPFLAKLKQRARETPVEEAGEPREPELQEAEAAPDTTPPTPVRDRRAVAFWQSDVCGAHIRRRISGDADVSPAAHFASLLEDEHRVACAVSLRAGDPKLELELLRRNACREITLIDGSTEKLDYARARVDEDLRERVGFEAADLLSFEPRQPPGIVVASSALHRVDDPDAVVARIADWLAPGGIVYVDEFVGPDRFQWTDAQIEIVNRLLACLPEELRVDLAGAGDKPKTEIGRPDRERFSRDHPHEAVAGSRIRAALDAHLEPVEARPYGGAVFHQLFARIMGNFVRRPELVRLILELDAILTDNGVVASDYLWAAYRRPV